MKFKKTHLISFIIPATLAFYFAFKIYKDNPTSFLEEYIIVLLSIFIFWVMTAIAGILLSQVVKKSNFNFFAPLIPQCILLFGFIWYAFFYTQPKKSDPNENLKHNRLFVDFDKSLDDSISRFPNFIRIAYRKLEEKFEDPNRFRLTYFGSDTSESLLPGRIVYFSYISSDSTPRFSKIEVIEDSARILVFDKSDTDTAFQNTKLRLTTWAVERIKGFK